MPKPLVGKVVLITGAAGGIGAAMSAAYADAGATVIVGYNRSADSAKVLCASLSGRGHVAKYAPVLNTGVLQSLADEINSDFGRLDILINNAGILLDGDGAPFEIAAARLMMEVNWTEYLSKLREEMHCPGHSE